MYWFYKARWYLGVFCVLALAIGLVKWSSWLDMKLGFPKPRSVAQRPAQSTGLPAPTSSSSSATTQTASRLAATTDVRVQLSQASGLLSEASVYASEALKEALTWQHDVEPLRERVIAESVAIAGEGEKQDELVDKLAYVMRRERMTSEELGAATTQIESLRLKVDKLTQQSSPTALSAVEIAEVSQLHTKCKKANEDWERDVRQALAIAHLMDQAKGTTPAISAPSPTLGGKINDADANAALANLNEEIVTAKVKAEKERQKEKEEAELLEKARSPEVKALLSPFLHARSVQPRKVGGGSVQFYSTFDEAPMSLSAIKTIGALEPTVEGLKWLARVGASRKLSSPRWGVGSQPNSWSDDDRKMLKDAQQALRDYGHVLLSE